MKKNEQLEAWLQQWKPQGPSHFPREYRAFFTCFNASQYYEAHDVLEHLWLRCSGPDRSFYQALIQVAGAFVHFQKHALFPHHPTHQRRLAPGRRLLALADNRLQTYAPSHLGLDVAGLRQGCRHWAWLAHQENPLQTLTPLLVLQHEPSDQEAGTHSA